MITAMIIWQKGRKSQMKSIRIIRLVLENFKCHRYLELDLRGRNAAIYGDNAAGKTSIYDAVTWLLFGKDSKGNGEKSIDLKPLGQDGQVADHQAITAVEAVLDVGGQAVTLRRTLREVWSTKRGSSQESFDGNTSEYFVDGVPQKKYGYDAKIREIVPEDIFRLLTSVTHFARDLGWQERRAALFDAATPAPDAEIMASDPRFAPLAAAAGSRPLADYKRKLQADRKGLTGVKIDTPARISELQALMEQYRAIDSSGLQMDLEAAAARRTALEQELAELRSNNLAASKRAELQKIQAELRALEAENAAYRASQGNQSRIAQLKAELGTAQAAYNGSQSQRTHLEAEMDDLSADIEACRAEWTRWNGDTFTGGACPTCGQMLPSAALERAKNKHQAQVDEGKAGAIERSNRQKGRLEKCQAAAQKLDAEMRESLERLGRLQAELQEAESEALAIEDMPGYAGQKHDLQEAADTLNSQLYSIEGNIAATTANIKSSMQQLDAEIRALNGKLAKGSMIPELESRIADLRKQAADAATQLEAIDQQMWLIEEFIRYKASFLEDSVNGLFRLARFRLFRQQANGGLEERCDVVYGGVPYASINSGAQINVGIDIINTMSRVHGVSVPLFVDNAESVTHLESMDTQVIRLAVSEADKKLRCEYEN